MNRTDEHGKVFTERVRKEGVEVKIATLQGQVHGYIHVLPGERVKDLLNNGAEQFLAVTGATLYGYDGMEIQQIDFIALSKLQIVSVIPCREIKTAGEKNGEYYIPR